jgi:hypothetical protein
MAVTLVRSSFPALGEVALGCLVPDPNNPGQDNWPQTRFTFSSDQIYTRPDDDLINFLNERKNTQLCLNMTRFLFGSGNVEVISGTKVFTATAVEYLLRDPIMHFKTLCKDDKTKQWIEEMYRQYPVFLIVGFTTGTDIKSESTHHKSTALAGAAELPITSIVSHGAAEVLPEYSATVLDVGAKASREHEANVVSSSIVRGERVLGVKYRRVVMRSLLARNVDKAKLGDNQWFMFTGGPRSGSDEIIEADLLASMEGGDLELDDQLETYTASGEKGSYAFVIEEMYS